MPEHIPYRKPCSGGHLSRCKALLFKQKTGRESRIKKFSNTTAVPNWNTTEGQPATIPPYERYHDNSSGGDCESNFCVPGGAPCGAWPEPVPTNVFTDTGDFLDMSICRKRGWKAVQSARSWHGAFPWTAPEHLCQTDLCAGSSAGFQAYQPNPSQVKYLKWECDVHSRQEAQIGEHDSRDTDKTGYRLVGAQTGGEIASTLTTKQTSKFDFGSGLVTTALTDGGAGYTDVDGDGTHDTDFLKGGTTILDNLDNDLHCNFPLVIPGNTDRGDLRAFILTWNAGLVDDPSEFTGSSLPDLTNPNSYSGSASGTSNGGGTFWSVSLSFSRSATVVGWDFTFIQINNYGLETTFTNTFHYYGTLTLSSPNYGDAVLADIYDNLLATWPLNNDALYPWRTDLRGSLAPYVTRKEVGNTSPIGFNPVQVDDLMSPIDDSFGNHPFESGWVPTYNLRAWYDDSIYIWRYDPGEDATTAAATSLYKVFTGAILGAPKPAGYQDPFDFLFQDVRGCCNHPTEGENQWEWYPLGSGMTVGAVGISGTFNEISGTQLPRNATQWNNWFMAANKPAGAWIIYADSADYFPGVCINSDGSKSGAGDTGKIVACKYAEVLEQFPSENFGMPAGDMKFWFDETRVVCATNVSGSGAGSVWALIDPTTHAAPGTVEPDDIWGGPSVGGFYAIAGWDGTNVTLGIKQSEVPSNWASKSHGDEATCFGPLRWKDFPALAGRAEVSTTGLGTTFTFGAAQPAFGMDARLATAGEEKVDLYDAAMTAVATNVTATRISDTQFSIVTGQPNAVWAQIHGSPKYYFNDNDPKGDWTVLQWWFDYRTLQEAESLRTVCDGTTPITVPSTITYPDADGNGHSVTVAMPGNGYRRFKQTPGCLPFLSCAPRVVCISPNGETWKNGTTIAMPTTLVWDEQYGTRYQAVVESTMTSLFWQAPHRPCNIRPCALWEQDDGTCKDNEHPSSLCPGDEGYAGDLTPKFFYALAPLVEARLSVPSTYGPGQDEAGPALPDGIQIGWLSPVDHAPAAGVAFPPLAPGPESSTGRPGLCAFRFALHQTLCDSEEAGCVFGYSPSAC